MRLDEMRLDEIRLDEMRLDEIRLERMLRVSRGDEFGFRYDEIG